MLIIKLSYSAILILGISSKEYKNKCLHINLYMSVYDNIIHNR